MHSDFPRKKRCPLLRSLSFVLAASVCCVATGGPPDDEETLVVRLVHPERQAAQVLKLFEGSRAPHPAAALAAWKNAAREPDQLGKPLEAVIAFFNPDMASEWRLMHGAELIVNWDPATGGPRWHAIVPQDDGTIAAVVAVSRLSDAAGEAPFLLEGNAITVARLGRPGALVAAHPGDSVAFGSTSEELVRAIRRLTRGKTDSVLTPRKGPPPHAGPCCSALPFESGASFALDATRLASVHAGTRPVRLTAELLRGVSCRSAHGTVALIGGCIEIEATTHQRVNEGPPAPLWNRSASIDASWLRLMPSTGAMAVVSLAFDPSPAFWDSAFALADALEKTEPDRAELAPLRSRLNLLATGAGARLEADLWPHLRGATAGILADPSRPGRPTGGLLALHLDSDEAALRLVSHALPRLAKLLDRGRELAFWQNGRNVIVVWGDGVSAAAKAAAANPALSVAPLCTRWLEVGKTAPARLAVLWPARCWPLGPGPVARSAAWSALAEDPPAVWWGWNEETKTLDSLRWPLLDQRVRRFLEQIELKEPLAR
jgi:hypothetical protein